MLDRLSDPYAPHVGIAEQTALAGVDHAVLYAVYTHHTTGYLTNERLADLLLDGRNEEAGDGRPWAWGFASINFDDWDADVAGERLAALRALVLAHPTLVRGIKLAHAHQQVSVSLRPRADSRARPRRSRAVRQRRPPVFGRGPLVSRSHDHGHAGCRLHHR